MNNVHVENMVMKFIFNNKDIAGVISFTDDNNLVRLHKFVGGEEINSRLVPVELMKDYIEERQEQEIITILD